MKKSKGLNSGYIFAPYITVNMTTIISDSDFSPKSTLKSRYSQVISPSYFVIFGKNLRRKEKIENILKLKPTE